MKARPSVQNPDSADAAYFRALRWLTARELSEAQVRLRLVEQGFTHTAIAAAIDRLLENRTIDDRRAASVVARTEARVRRHGPSRIFARLMAMKIDRELAKDVVRELFGDEDARALLESALERRLRGKTERLKDPAERRRLQAYLVRQGFSPSAAAAVLRARSRGSSSSQVK